MIRRLATLVEEGRREEEERKYDENVENAYVCVKEGEEPEKEEGRKEEVE